MYIYVLLFTFCSIAASQYTNLEIGISRFGFDFYKECARTKSGDIIISPISVASVLGLLSQAANGTTYNQIKTGLQLFPRKEDVANQYQKLYSTLDKDKGPSTLSIVNEIYVQKGHEINKNFNDVAKDKFKAGIESLNFGDSEKSAKTINDFVQSKTNKKIMEIVKPNDLNGDTEMVLLNAIYFKADWELKFNKSLTFKAPFYTMNAKNDTVEAEFMTQKAKFFYGESRTGDSTAIELRYANSNLSFVIVLPNKDKNFKSIESASTYDELNQMLFNQLELIEVNVTIPKFGVEYEIDLKNTLEKLGMGEMFKQTSDLSGLFVKPKELRVSKAIHKAVIEVNEDGSEASAATGLSIENRSGFSRSETFIANRPFLFYIRDTNNRVILFSGRVENLQSAPTYNKNGASHLTMSYAILAAMMIFWSLTS